MSLAIVLIVLFPLFVKLYSRALRPVDLCIRRDAAAALFKSQGCQHQPAPLHLRHGSRHVLRPERPFYSLENVGGHTPEKDTPARALPVSPADSGSAGHHGTDVHGN